MSFLFKTFFFFLEISKSFSLLLCRATFLQVMPQMIYPAIADYVHPFFRLSQNETLFFKEVLSDAASVNARSLTVLENGAQLRGAHILVSFHVLF